MPEAKGRGPRELTCRRRPDGVRRGLFLAGTGLRTADLPSPDVAVLKLVDVLDRLIDEHFPTQVAHNLVHAHRDASIGFTREGLRLNLRIEHGPLPPPVVPHPFDAFNPAAFPSIGPGHLWMQSGENALEIASVEGRVAPTQHSFRIHSNRTPSGTLAQRHL